MKSLASAIGQLVAALLFVGAIVVLTIAAAATGYFSQVTDWGSFGQVVGDASGALVGLLFVAVSLNRDRIAHNPALRASAAQTLMVFMLPLLAVILLLTPRQPSWVLGIELIALGVVHGAAQVMAGRGKRTAGHEVQSQLARVLDRVVPNDFTTLLVVGAGATVVAGHVEGLYWLVPAVLLALIGGVASTWLFLISDPDQV